MTEHLVILEPRWLRAMKHGDKTVEFRASNRRIAPWEKVARGDRLWLKESGGPISATCRVERAEFRGPFEVTELADFLATIDDNPDGLLDAKWAARLTTNRYVSLTWCHRLTLLPDLDIRDMRGGRQDSWQVLNDDHAALIRSRLPLAWKGRL